MQVQHIPIESRSVPVGTGSTIGKVRVTVGSEAKYGFIVASRYEDKPGYYLTVSWPILWAVGIAPKDSEVIEEWIRLQRFYHWQCITFNLC